MPDAEEQDGPSHPESEEGDAEQEQMSEQEYAWLQQQIARLAQEGGGAGADAEAWEDPTGGPLTELLEAAENGEADKVSQLLADKTWDVNLPGPDGDTALHLACLYGYDDVVTALLAAGAAADCENVLDGSTPLHDAAAGGYLAICEALLAKGGDAMVGVSDEDGDTPLHNAARGNHCDVISLLLAHGADRKAQNHEGNLPEDEADEEPSRALLKPDR